MSLLEAESARRKKRSRRKARRILPKWSPLNKPFSATHPDQVLSFHDWCRLNCISESTGRRILASGNGPAVTELGAKRIGITVGNNAAWQASKARA
jgi:hypothetical protein